MTEYRLNDEGELVKIKSGIPFVVIMREVECADCGAKVQVPDDWPLGKPAYCYPCYKLRVEGVKMAVDKP